MSERQGTDLRQPGVSQSESTFVLRSFFLDFVKTNNVGSSFFLQNP